MLQTSSNRNKTASDGLRRFRGWDERLWRFPVAFALALSLSADRPCFPRRISDLTRLDLLKTR